MSHIALSIYLFIVMMNYAIQRACTRIVIYTNFRKLPLILAYADDIIILTDFVQSTDRVFTEIEQELNAIGFFINESKSSILLRDPVQSTLLSTSDSVTLNKMSVKVVSVLKYLGIYISSDRILLPQQI